MQSLLRVLNAARFAEDDHFDAAAVAPLAVQALGDLASHDLRLVVTDLVRLDENAELLAGEHREAALDAAELVGDRLDALEPLDCVGERLPAGTRSGCADGICGHENGCGWRSRLLVVVMRPNGLHHRRRAAEAGQD